MDETRRRSIDGPAGTLRVLVTGAMDLRALGLPSCQPVDLPFLRRMIDFAVASGLLPAHRTSG